MKRMTAILLAMVMLISSAQFALASMTTEEKSELYKKAIRELEAYLETPNSSGESLYGIQSIFQSLGRFDQSQNLNYYTTVLIKLYEETYDYDMLSNLELLELDRRFQDYLNNEMKGSPLCSVEELKSYAEAREKEHSGDVSGAMECYRNCMSFFDASKRYRALREAGDEQKYNQALAMQNAGDFAGAYFLFSDIVRYRDSENRKRAIENVLGYTPASPSDNLRPVTGLTVKMAKETEITLSWQASSHAKTYEVQYRENNSGIWLNVGETNSTGLTVNGLKANTTYAFRVTAAIEKIKAEAAEIIAKTSAQVTPMPKLTPTPTPKAELPDGKSIAPAPSIPTLPYNYCTVRLKNSNVKRIRPQCGPGYNYAVFASMSGSTKLYDPRKITYMNARFCVGDWAYIEFGYSDGVQRFGFFEKSLFTPSGDWSNVLSYSLKTEKHGKITSTTTPYNGPSTNCGSYPSCKLHSGDAVHACMESNGWYLCRFYNGHSNNYGEIYLWIPGSSISWN